MTPNSSQKIDFLPKLTFEEILASPILDIAARTWEPDRYGAFKICYRSMRILDNLVDNRRSLGSPISDHERAQFSKMIDDFTASLKQPDCEDAFAVALVEIMKHYRIPVWPWQRLARAMIFDLHHDEFRSFTTFLRYSEGAAIAPASIFVHLCGVTNNGDGFKPPDFNIRHAARHLALFSYLVHILRDFRKDQLAGLNYFPADLMRRHGISSATLKESVTTNVIDDRVRGLIADVVGIADRYRGWAREKLEELFPRLDARYRLSLEIIYSLYCQILERVDPSAGTFTAEELQPTPAEIQAQMQHLARQ